MVHGLWYNQNVEETTANAAGDLKEGDNNMALHYLTKKLVDLIERLVTMGLSEDIIRNTINLLTVLPDNQSTEKALNELEKLAKVQTNDRDWAYDSGQIIKKYLKVL